MEKTESEIALETAQSLLGEGRPITLLDGRTVTLYCTNRTMMKIEEQYGSYAQLRAMFASGVEGPLFMAVSRAVWAMLQYDPYWRERWNELLDNLIPDKVLDEYQDAVMESFSLAFPPKPQDRTATEPATPLPMDQAVKPSSPGATSAGGPNDTSESASTNSGT